MNCKHRLGITSARFILITLACIFAVFGVCLLLVCSVITGSGEQVESTQRRLLYATNPSSLMDACRQLSTANGAGTSGEPVFPDPTSSALPPIIQKVHPRTITIDDGRVTLECGTNVYRFGLAVDVNAPAGPSTGQSTGPSTGPTTRPAPPMATRMLAPGVWYYAEDKTVPGP